MRHTNSAAWKVATAILWQQVGQRGTSCNPQGKCVYSSVQQRRQGEFILKQGEHLVVLLHLWCTATQVLVPPSHDGVKQSGDAMHVRQQLVTTANNAGQKRAC
jgi:hypothetical protein